MEEDEEAFNSEIRCEHGGFRLCLDLNLIDFYKGWPIGVHCIWYYRLSGYSRQAQTAGSSVSLGHLSRIFS